MTETFVPCIQKDVIVQLQNDWDMQKNEAINICVASYAPKNKTYSTIKSLDVRVDIAAGIQILGYKNLWLQFFTDFELRMDDSLLNSLRQRDVNKTNKSIIEKS